MQTQCRCAAYWMKFVHRCKSFSAWSCACTSPYSRSLALKLVVWLQYPFPPNAPRTAAVQLGFLPLNHLMGRMTLLKCLMTGGQVC